MKNKKQVNIRVNKGLYDAIKNYVLKNASGVSEISEKALRMFLDKGKYAISETLLHRNNEGALMRTETIAIFIPIELYDEVTLKVKGYSFTKIITQAIADYVGYNFEQMC